MKLERSRDMTIMHYDLEKIVRSDHVLRKIDNIISFNKLAKMYTHMDRGIGRHGYGVEVGIRSIFLQFYYDLSDRMMRDRLKDDMGFKWFCGFSIDEGTPDHTYFCRIRKTLGTGGIAKIFRKINKLAKEKGIIRDVFTFVDATAIRVKETTWAERDKAIAEGEEKLNNDNINKYSKDKDARFGCKGKDKFWYGYKQHTGVDMGSGLINKAAVTPANVSDAKGLKHICPSGGMVFGDKGYCINEAQKILQERGCHSGVILKNNMLGKNRDKDKWLTKVRAQFEGVFSQKEKRARYRGIAKVQMQSFMESIVFNVKRLITINAPPLFAGA